MSEQSPDEPSIATAGAARTAELATGGTDPVAERRRAFERERRASAKASLGKSQHTPPTPELRNRRLEARNGNEPSARSPVTMRPAANNNLIDKTVAVWQETSPAAMQATGYPAWAALSAPGLQALERPAEAPKPIVLTDGDEPGEAAAIGAAYRWRDEGRCVRIARPPRDSDFNDLLQGRNIGAVLIQGRPTFACSPFPAFIEFA
jgi:Toprim domain-containing protein